MKIADLFVQLGFKTDGGKELATAQAGVEKLEFSSVKLLVGLTALNTAFFALMARGAQMGVTLQRFSVLTGQSTTELQRWQAAAAKSNVSASTIVQAIEQIQRTQAEIRFGNKEAYAPWALLGLDPTKDPFKVLDALRERIKNMDPAIARKVLGDMGLGDDLLFLLRQKDFNLGGGRSIIISKEESDRLARLGGAWKYLLFTLQQVGGRFASEFAEPITEVLKGLGRVLELGGKFVDWLQKGGSAATAVKYAILGVVTALAGLNIAAGLLAFGPFGQFVGLVGVLSVAIGGLVFLIQDFWTACRGGKSAFDWNDNLILSVRNVERLAGAITAVNEQIHLITTNKAYGQTFAREAGATALSYGSGYGFIRDFVRWNWRMDDKPGAAASSTVNQTLNFNGPNSNSVQDIARGTRRAVTDAAAQIPAATK